MTGPELINVQLENCFREVLKDIESRYRIGKLIQGFVLCSPFITLFSESPPFWIGHLMHTHWEELGRALTSVSAIVRERCATIAFLHIDKHPCCELYTFWKAMYERFSS